MLTTSSWIALSIFIVFALALHLGSLYEINRAIDNTMGNLDSVEARKNSILHTSIVENNKRASVLQTQYFCAQGLKKTYLDTAIIYFRNYYIFSVCLIAYTCILSVVVFLIAVKGWKDSNELLKTLFIVATLATTLYYFLPSVFNNNDNFTRNITAAKYYHGVQMDILSIVHSKAFADTAKTDTAIANIDQQIKVNYDFFTTINAGELNSNALNLLKELKK